jgi:hypothetical protein
MIRKRVGKNTRSPGRVDPSGPELAKCDAEVRAQTKVGLSESTEVAPVLLDNSDCGEAGITSQPIPQAVDS